MADHINDGGQAFPGQPKYWDDDFGEYRPSDYIAGMTLRDYFAAHATEEDLREQGEVIRNGLIQAAKVAILPDGWRTAARYMHADAMLKAREAK